MLGPARSDSCEGVTSVDLAEPSRNFGEDLALRGSFWLLKERGANAVGAMLRSPSNQTELHVVQVSKRPDLP